MSNQQPPGLPPQHPGYPPPGAYGPPPQGYPPQFQGYPPQFHGYPQQGTPWPGPRPPPPRKTTLLTKLVTVLVTLLGLLVIIPIFARARAAADSPIASSQTGAAREPLSQSCAEVADTFSNRTQLTELQREAAWRDGYRGRWVRWTATVNSVDRSLFGGLRLQFKCSPQSLVMDGHASFGSGQEASLMRYSRGQEITFEGRLSDWGQFLGMSIEDATVVP